MKKFGGIDGCKGGWILCEIDRSKPSISFIHVLDEINALEFDTLLIDIPLYFADRAHRPSEIQAKNLLKKRGASIFLTPVKEAVFEKSYEEGLKINRRLIGKGFSKQAYYLFPKIKEAAGFKEKNRNLIFESHPELCFLGWNKAPLAYSKKTKEGKQERLDLIQKIDLSLYQTLETFKYKEFFEDAIDASILALTAKERKRFSYLGDKENESIVYYDPKD